MTAVESNLALQAYPEGEWRPPILKTSATTGQGLAELWASIERYRSHTEGSRDRRVRARSEFRLRELLTQRFLHHLEREVLAPGEFDAILSRIAARTLDPYSATAELLARTLVSTKAHS